MTQKELNQAILAELYKAGDKTIQLYMKIKDGIYTAKEINDRKDKLGKNLCYIVTENVSFDIQVEDFKCHADTMNIFMIIERMEKLCRVKEKATFATKDDITPELTVTAKCVYYKKNGNDLARRNKALKLIADNLGITSNELYYKAGDNWYYILYFTSESYLNKVVSQIINDPELIRNGLKNKIENNSYINSLEIELCAALGLDKQAAINARETCLAERAKKEEEAERIRRQEEQERIEREITEKEEKLNQAESDYLSGKKIEPELFEGLCERYGLTLSPKQKRSLRERIAYIGRDNYSFYRIKGKRDPKIDGIIKIAYELYDLIDEAINKNQFVDITNPEEIKKISNFGAEETDDIDIDIERFLNGESVTFDKENQSEPETGKPDTFVTIDFAECKFDIDFTDSLNDKVQYEESFSELIEGMNDEETKDLAYDELYKRAINYAHERFSGYINRVAMSYMAVDKLFEQLGLRNSDLSHENTS